jgi:ribonuclease P protein component
VSVRAYALEASARREGSRLGLVVSRRVGGAVVRNRVKRVVREWFRRNRAAFPGDLELVVIARSEAAKLSTGEAWRELSALAARATR